MRAYIDTSALLRLVLREAGALDELRSCESLVSSELLAVESFRTIDRLRLHGTQDADLFVHKSAENGRALAAALRDVGFDLTGAEAEEPNFTHE